MKRYLILLGIIFIFSCNNKPTLKILGESSSNLQAMESLKGDYEKQAGIEIQFMPNTFVDANTKANEDFANGTGLYDIDLLYNFSLSLFVRKNYVYKIDELTQNLPDSQKSFEKDIFPSAWQELGYYYKDASDTAAGIVRIGYPFAANTMILVYNKEMFEDAANRAAYNKKYHEELQVPRDWEHYKRVAEFFTNPSKKTYGVCMQGAAGGWLYYEYCNFLYGMGGTVFEKQRGWQGDANTPARMNTAEALKATQLYKSLKPYNAGDFKSTDATMQTQLLKNGNIAMGIVWSDYLYNFTFDKGGTIDQRFGFAPVPGNKSALAGGIFYINRKSTHANEAVKYILHLLQPASQVALVKKGLCSPVRSVYDHPQINKMPYIPALKSSLERGVYMFEAGPESDVVSQIITTYLQRCWNDEITVEQALTQVQEEIIKERKELYKNLK